jgi:putative acetyltransferase
MITVLRTNSDSKDFIELVKQLDTFLAAIDGEEHAFYNSLNQISNIKYAVVAYENDIAVGCGAMKAFSETAVEVKRMYCKPEHRRKGIAEKVLTELELWAADLNYESCVLETGKKQPEAIALYKKNGYQIIPNYGQYLNIENSCCFEKKLK